MNQSPNRPLNRLALNRKPLNRTSSSNHRLNKFTKDKIKHSYNNRIRTQKQKQKQNQKQKQKLTNKNRQINYNNRLINNLVKKCLLKKGSKEVKIFKKVNRIDFCLDETNEDTCYFDKPDKLSSGQTITAPHLHAHAVNTLKHHLKPGSKVLDVGCGSGILCAIFAYLVDIDKNPNSLVIGIDIYDDLITKSINNIKKNHSHLFNYNRLKIFKANGWNGISLNNDNIIEKEIFDVIHVGAQSDDIPEMLWYQLKAGGRMFIPMEFNGMTNIYIIDKPIKYKNLGEMSIQTDLSVRYVPLQKNNK